MHEGVFYLQHSNPPFNHSLTKRIIKDKDLMRLHPFVFHPLNLSLFLLFFSQPHVVCMSFFPTTQMKIYLTSLYINQLHYATFQSTYDLSKLFLFLFFDTNLFFSNTFSVDSFFCCCWKNVNILWIVHKKKIWIERKRKSLIHFITCITLTSEMQKAETKVLKI